MHFHTFLTWCQLCLKHLNHADLSHFDLFSHDFISSFSDKFTGLGDNFRLKLKFERFHFLFPVITSQEFFVEDWSDIVIILSIAFWGKEIITVTWATLLFLLFAFRSWLVILLSFIGRAFWCSIRWAITYSAITSSAMFFSFCCRPVRHIHRTSYMLLIHLMLQFLALYCSLLALYRS